jgi:hypothetical protein
MWRLAGVALGSLGALGGCSGAPAKEEFVAQCVAALATEGGTDEVRESVCWCTMDKGEEHKRRHADTAPSVEQMAEYIVQCGRDNGLDLSEGTPSPWD